MFTPRGLALLGRPPSGAAQRVKVRNGSSWVVGTLKVWNGSAWVAGHLKVWNGSSWV